MGKFAEPINSLEENRSPGNLDITSKVEEFATEEKEKPCIEAYEKATRTNDFEILFNDSPEYFIVESARMIQEGKFVRFICFDDNLVFHHDEWYPINKIHRIKRYKEYQGQDVINE
jgi:hypothetical protein